MDVVLSNMHPKSQKVQFESRYNGQEGVHHHYLSTAIDRVTNYPHGTQLMASQLLLVFENRHAEVWRLRPKLGRACRESPTKHIAWWTR